MKKEKPKKTFYTVLGMIGDCLFVPIMLLALIVCMFIFMERRHGEMKPVIKKALVELDGPVFKALEQNRDKWAINDCYVFPGAVQYFGPACVCDVTTLTLQLEQEKALVNV